MLKGPFIVMCNHDNAIIWLSIFC